MNNTIEFLSRRSRTLSRFVVALVALAFVAADVSIVRANEANRPNVLFILIDDFGWHDVGYNGSTFYETPAMDALSRQWMRFDNCYTPSPMCSPTRISILTGKNPARHGVTQWLPGVEKAFTRKGEKPRVFCPLSKSKQIADNETTIGEAFKKAGYETAFYGKWHMGSFADTGGPANHGFDSQRAVIESNRCKMFYPFWDHPEYFPNAKEGDNFTDLLTDAAIKYMTQQRDKPFYLHLSHFAMHAPIGSKPELRDHFQKKADRLPAIEDDWISDDLYAHKPYKRRQDDAEYAGELATLDQNIGRLVESLKTAGILDDTIIILTGDNGGRSCEMQGHPTSNEPLRTGKTYVFEGGIKTPLLIHWPGKTKPGDQTNTPVMSTDFFPTLLEMTGQSLLPDQHVDGTSLVPLIEGDKLDRDALYWHFPHYQGEGSYPASAIRVGNFKLIHNYHHNDILLYDVVSDPNETKNLVSAMPNKARDLDERLMKYLSEVGATIPQPKVLAPKQENNFTWVYKPAGDKFYGPDTQTLKTGQWYDDWVPNDHTFVKGDDGKWHIFGITHPYISPDPKSGGIHRGEFASFHAASSATSFKGSFQKHHFSDLPKVLPPSERPDEPVNNHAPYVVKKDGLFHMVYGPSPIRLAVSKDLLKWKLKGNLFEQEGGARDPSLLLHDGVYYMSYCSERSVLTRTSKDLKNWSKPKTIFTADSFDPESPTLIRFNDTFYLFVCSWDGVWDRKEIQGAYQHKTYVYQSDDLLQFGVGNEKEVAKLNSHAPEIFQDEEGQWYISSVEWPNRGVSVDRLTWENLND